MFLKKYFFLFVLTILFDGLLLSCNDLITRKRAFMTVYILPRRKFRRTKFSEMLKIRGYALNHWDRFSDHIMATCRKIT